MGLLYQPAAVTPIGAASILDSSFDPAYRDDRNRPALAQTFEENATGQRFTAVVNHLKSKGSACDDIGDPDVGDGQGNCNLTRTDAMTVELSWLATDPTGSGDPDFLILGDLNSYAQEDPIAAAIDAGYVNLLNSFAGQHAYSYIYDGLSGYLDHALASPSLAAQATGASDWHINADEPAVIDYNVEYKSQDLYSPDAYRASDHDPLVVGLSLTGPMPDLDVSKEVWPSSDVPLGGTVVYTIAIANNGGADALGVVVSDALPLGLTFGGYLVNPGGTAQLPDPSGVIFWQYPVVSGASYSFVFSATVEAGTLAYGDTVTNTVYFSSDNAGSGSDEAVVGIAAAPPLFSAVKTVWPTGDVGAGAYLTYTIALTNGDTSQVSLSLTDTLPGDLLLVRGLDGGSALTWAGDLPADSSTQLTLVVQANPDVAADTAVSNTVHISFGAGEPLPVHSPDTTILAEVYYSVYLPLLVHD